jgi:methyltransferase (TIGR00027 family)
MRADRPSRTAEFVALQRALDQRNPPERRIVDDPYAHCFLGTAARTALAAFEKSGRIGDFLERSSSGLTAYVQARHRFMDDRLVESLARVDDEIRQVVVLGAGYDMRAHRFAAEIRGRPVFEVDHPATGRRKARVLEELRKAGTLSGPGATPVGVDFQTQALAERLLECGFDSGGRTFFVWEGVSMYLRREAVKAALRSMAELGGPGSELVMDCWFLLDEPDLRGAAHRLSANLLQLLGEPVLFGIHPEDVGPFLSRVGWRLLETADAATLEARYIRDGRQVHPANYVLWARSELPYRSARGAGRSGRSR